MDHGYFRDRISAYLDGGLPPYEEQAVGEHLQTCEECARLLEELRQVERLVEEHSNLDGDEYWEGLAQKIEGRLGVDEATPVVDVTPARWRGLWWKVSAVAASVVLLVFIGIHQTEILKQEDAPTEFRAPNIVPPSMVGDSLATDRVGHDDKLADTRDDFDAEAKKIERPAVQPPASPEADAVKEKTGTLGAVAEAKVEEELREQEVTRDLDQTINVSGVRLDSVMAVPGATVVMDEVEEESVSIMSLADNQPSAAARALAPQKAGERLSSDFAAPSPPDSLDLVGWTLRRDSLAALWADMSGPHGKLVITKQRADRGLANIELVERQLLDASFEVGRLSADVDSTAHADVVSFFETYLQRPDARYRDIGRQYLDRLMIDSTDR